MIIGMLLMVVGAMLVLRNRQVAVLFGREPQIDQWGFMTSVVRQNIAVMGAACFIGGLIFFLLF